MDEDGGHGSHTVTTEELSQEANMRAAQDFCQAEPGEAEAGLRMAIHGWFYYYDGAEGHISEARYRLGHALAEARAPTVWRARGLLAASHLAGLSGDPGALPPLEQGAGLAGQLNDPVTSASPPGSPETPACRPVTCRQPSPITRTGWRSGPHPPPIPASGSTC
jgi:hypothetical protein